MNKILGASLSWKWMAIWPTESDAQGVPRSIKERYVMQQQSPHQHKICIALQTIVILLSNSVIYELCQLKMSFYLMNSTSSVLQAAFCTATLIVKLFSGMKIIKNLILRVARWYLILNNNLKILLIYKPKPRCRLGWKCMRVARCDVVFLTGIPHLFRWHNHKI